MFCMRIRLILLLLFLIPVGASSQDIFNGTFDQSFYLPGLDGPISSAIVFEGELYIGGTFYTYNDQIINGIAKWEGNGWVALEDGINLQNFEVGVNQLIVIDNKLYAGGYFTYKGDERINNIAYWDGEKWNSVGDGLPNAVTELVEYEGDLIAYGAFQKEEENNKIDRISRWDGESWQPFDFRFPANENIVSLNSMDSLLLFSGDIDQIVTYNTIPDGMFTGEYEFTQIDTAFYRGDSSKWWLLGNGQRTFRSIIVQGSMSSSGVTYGDRHVQVCPDNHGYCPSFWLSFSDTVGGWGQNVTIDTYINDYCVGRDNTLGPTNYLKGSFNSTDDSEFILAIREENYNCVQGLDEEIRFQVQKVKNSTNAKKELPNRVDNIFIWNGSEIQSFPRFPVDSNVYSTFHNGEIYAGYSDNVSDQTVSKIFKWTNDSWVQIGDEITGFVSSITSIDEELIIYGNIESISGQSIHGVAIWSDNSWSQLGNHDFPFIVTTIAKFEDGYFISGRSDNESTQITSGFIDYQNKFRRIDSPQSGLGSKGRYTYAKEIDGTLYLYGAFEQVGSFDFNNFAFHNSRNGLRAFPSELGEYQLFYTDYITSVLKKDGELYVSGYWTQDDKSIIGVAKWDKDEWVQIGKPYSGGRIVELHEFQDTLYAVGYFSIQNDPNGSFSDRIYAFTKFNGKEWVDIRLPDIDFDSQAFYDILTFEDQLYISGEYSNQPYIATWDGDEWLKYPIEGLPRNSSFDNIAFYDGILHASISFENREARRDNSQIVRFVDGSWEQLGADFDHLVWFIIEHDGHLVVSGEFQKNGDNEIGPIAIWDGEKWRGLPSTVQIARDFGGRVYQMQSIDEGILFSGNFRYVDDIPTRNVGIYITDGSKNYLNKSGTKDDFKLSQNYPNPFNPTTNINITLPVSSVVKVDIYDMLGRKIQSVTNQRYSAGTHTVTFMQGL